MFRLIKFRIADAMTKISCWSNEYYKFNPIFNQHKLIPVSLYYTDSVNHNLSLFVRLVVRELLNEYTITYIRRHDDIIIVCYFNFK